MGFQDHPENINRNGRPKKGMALTEVLKNNVDPEEIAALLLEMARDKDLGALKYIYDRVDGKPKESIDVDQRGDMVYTIIKPKDDEDETD